MGSGNAGSTNALRTMGIKAGMITLLGDCFKCVIAVLVVRGIYGQSHADILPLLSLYTGFGAVLGHNFPFYLKFKGGKGIAVTAGMILSTDIRIAAVCLIVFIVIVAVTRYVSLGSLVISVLFLVGLVVDGQMGMFGMMQKYLFEMYGIGALFVLSAFIRHRANIGRLRNGTESKISFSKKKNKRYEIRKKRENPSKLPGVHIPEEIEITTDLQGSVEGKDVVVLAVPSMATRATAKKMCPYVKEEQILVNVAKGIEEGTLKTLSEQIEEEIPQANVAVLSGPSHAEEVSRELPTTVVVGAETEETAIYLQKIFMNDVFRVYTSPDIKGIELGGSLKNVIALAAGVADGLGYGDNTKAALITRGIAEITRLGVKMGGKLESFTGLTGIGDLIVTCASKHSRNRKAGVLIGEGMTMEEAMAEVKMVVEGVYSAKAARELAEKYEVSMPIVEKVNQVLFEGKPAKDAGSELMMRDGRSEYSNLPWD